MGYDMKSREVLGRIQLQMQSLLDGVDRGGRKHFTSAEREKWNALLKDHDEIETQVARNEISRVGASINRAAGASQPRIDETGLAGTEHDIDIVHAGVRGGRPGRDTSPHASAFRQYIRGGFESLDEEQRGIMRASWRGTDGLTVIRNAQSTGSGAAGAFTVPASFSYQLEEAMKYFGGIAGEVGEFRTDDGRPFPWPTTNDTTNKGRIIGENVQQAETDVVFGQVSFGAFIGSSDVCLVPLTLLQDSAFDIDALLARLLGIRLGRLVNYWCTVGTGTPNGPMGIVPAATAAGLIYQLGVGNTDAISYSQLVTLEHKVDPAYRNSGNCKWMFHDNMLLLIKQLVDGNNRPLWSPGLTASLQDGDPVIGKSKPRILGYEYLVNNDMAAPAASQYSALFGDMSCYKLRRVEPGVQLMRLIERYADYLQQGFQAWIRFDGNLIDAGTHPIAVLQQSAS